MIASSLICSQFRILEEQPVWTAVDAFSSMFISCEDLSTDDPLGHALSAYGFQWQARKTRP
jgi:hypothetical protein